MTYIPALKFHWLTKIYDRLISVLMPEKTFKKALLDSANIQTNFQVLDFGVGTATLSIMAYQLNNHVVYHGIDIDHNILEIAKRKIESKNIPINLIHYTGGAMPFEGQSIDRIISSLVFHHLTDEQKILTLKECRRILKPNGTLHIADWGRANNFFMRGLFHIVQLLDGYETTTANVKGNLPTIISNSGFSHVEIKKHFNTLLGTIEIFKISK